MYASVGKKWSYFGKKSLFEDYFLRWWSLVCQCLFYILVFSRALYSLFSFLKLWHTYPHCHLNRGSKWTHQKLKKIFIFCGNNILLKLNFQCEGYLYAVCLLYILTIYCKFLLLQFWSRGIGIRIPILTAVQKGGIITVGNGHILLQMYFLKLKF